MTHPSKTGQVPDSRDTQTILNQLAFAAFSRPWPGETGPTDARVLAGLLCQGDLTAVLSLERFANEVGLNDSHTVKAALERLEAADWGTFALGRADRYGPDHEIEEPGEPSTFVLNPHRSAGEYSPKKLPWLIADPFTRGAAGSAGWLLLARLLVETKDETRPMPLVDTADIMRLTGMSRSRAKRLKKNLVSAHIGHMEENGNKVRLTWLRETTETDRDHFDCLRRTTGVGRKTMAGHSGETRLGRPSKKPASQPHRSKLYRR